MAAVARVRVTGASWTKGTDVVKKTGKVLFTMAGGNYVCSASAVTNSRSNASLVLTAGHCAYDEVNEAFATNWLYVPSFDTSPTFTCASATFGCWTASALVVHDGYASAGGFNTQATIHDFAIAVVGGGGKPGQSIQLETLGSGTRSPTRPSRPGTASTRSAIRPRASTRART